MKVHQNTASGMPNGNGAWHSLVAWFETDEWHELMAASLERAIDGISYKESGKQTIGVSLTSLTASSISMQSIVEQILTLSQGSYAYSSKHSLRPLRMPT